MADFRDLEARAVPEHLWPDDAFQQKYSKPFMDALTTPLVTAQTPAPSKSKKGQKVALRLEFEQKFLLDPRRSREILTTLCQNPDLGKLPYIRSFQPRPGHSVCHIRQFYDDGDRYRSTSEVWGEVGFVAHPKYVSEKKKSIHLGTSYSANSEEEDGDVLPREFEDGWKGAKRRLQKVRFYVPSVHKDHRTVVDFFYTYRFSPSSDSAYVYAVMAEDEAILDADTTHLYLHFEIPIYLREYLVCTVDSRDQAMKVFRSANMIDTYDAIGEFERAISSLYGNPT